MKGTSRVRAAARAVLSTAWNPCTGTSAREGVLASRGLEQSVFAAGAQGAVAGRAETHNTASGYPCRAVGEEPIIGIRTRAHFSSVSAAAVSAFRAPPVTLETINPLVRECEYAVRGDIVTRAQALGTQLLLKPGSLPFSEVIYCNIGNPQSLGQQPVTFFREVLALCDYPALLQPSASSSLAFSMTARERAQRLLDHLPAHATGAYSHSKGITLCREDIAKGIAERDGHSADPETIFLTDGASPSVQMILRLLVRSKEDGVLCPIPQYPLYSATLAILGGTLVPYYLEERDGWRLSLGQLEKQLKRALEDGVSPRALVVINPGNPTGQVLNEEDQQDIVRFCCKHGLLLLADEVYQENVYAPGKKFTSFKKVARDMGVGPEDLALVSVHSASKGFYGECGRRGGYMEVSGVSNDVLDQIYKVASINLCSNVSGQILCSLIMSPPKEGDDAFELFDNERTMLLTSLANRAQSLVSGLNSVEGVTCSPSEGAMYAFPRLHLPSAALDAAAAVRMPADTFYARRLLDATGIVVVPGSGFGQEPGTWHLRFTILPPEEKLPKMMERFSEFHTRFLHEFN